MRIPSWRPKTDVVDCHRHLENCPGWRPVAEISGQSLLYRNDRIHNEVSIGLNNSNIDRKGPKLDQVKSGRCQTSQLSPGGRNRSIRKQCGSGRDTLRIGENSTQFHWVAGKLMLDRHLPQAELKAAQEVHMQRHISEETSH